MAGKRSYAWPASVRLASHVQKCSATVWAEGVLNSTKMPPADFLKWLKAGEIILHMLCNLRPGLLITASIDFPKNMWRTSTTALGHGKYLAFHMRNRPAALQMQRATSGTTSETCAFQTAKSHSCLLGWENAGGPTCSFNRFNRQIWKTSINIINIANGQILNLVNFLAFAKTMLASLASNSWTLNLPQPEVLVILRATRNATCVSRSLNRIRLRQDPMPSKCDMKQTCPWHWATHTFSTFQHIWRFSWAQPPCILFDSIEHPNMPWAKSSDKALRASSKKDIWLSRATSQENQDSFRPRAQYAPCAQYAEYAPCAPCF